MVATSFGARGIGASREGPLNKTLVLIVRSGSIGESEPVGSEFIILSENQSVSPVLQKPPTNPTHSTTRRQTTLPQSLPPHHLCRVRQVRRVYVEFLAPGVCAPLTPDSTTTLPMEWLVLPTYVGANP